MTPTAEQQRSALEPLSAGLLARARARADGLRAAAEAEAREVLDAARAEAARLLAEARARGESDAAAVQAVELARVRAAGRALVLDAQREAYDELLRRAQTATADLLADGGARTRLAALLRQRLGDHDADVVAHPDGGLVGVARDGRRVDASVAALVESAVADLDLERLWTAG